MNHTTIVQNEHGLVRDSSSKAILNTDLDAKKAFMKEREQTLTIMNIQEKLDVITSDVSEIKKILKIMSELRCDHNFGS
jgi:uncharacterized protein with gpF-like domain